MDLFVDWFDLASAVYSLYSLQDFVRLAWFPSAASVQAMGEKAISAIGRLEQFELPMKLCFWNWLECRIPPYLPKLSTQMELLRIELNGDELEKKLMREHLGALYGNSCYASKEGTAVCPVLYRGT